jgi:hypothetical protein
MNESIDLSDKRIPDNIKAVMIELKTTNLKLEKIIEKLSIENKELKNKVISIQNNTNVLTKEEVELFIKNKKLLTTKRGAKEKYTQDDIDTVWELFKQGKQYREIADITGIKMGSLGSLVNKAKLKYEKRGEV